jgi:UbiD family decarboxylase
MFGPSPSSGLFSCESTPAGSTHLIFDRKERILKLHAAARMGYDRNHRASEPQRRPFQEPSRPPGAAMKAPRRIPKDLPAFLQALEVAGELVRVRVPVDADLEITEIASRMVSRGGPALLFESVRGSPYPLAINIFAGARKLEIALGRPPGAIGEELSRLLERLNPPTIRGVLTLRRTLWRLAQMRSRKVLRPPCQAVVESPDLERIPALRCWPRDGGRFLTYPLVITRGPGGRRNVGLYRMHIHGKDTTGMHWQIQKGGGFHHARAESEGRPLPVAVVIGADPALLIAAMAPLPEDVDEVAFSGFLRGRPARLARARMVPLLVPADAEFILEGIVPPGERKTEGPFGDHYGHYSDAAPFPVFHILKITRKRRPIYHASVVGKPPMEDLYLGNAVQEMLGPLVRALHPEVRDLWAYGEAGFHTLLVVSVESRYGREGVKTALGLLGDGQLSLSKVVIVVDPATSARDFRAVLRAIRSNFDPARDFLLIPGTPMDTLDFSSLRRNLGSKMVLIASKDLEEEPAAEGGGPRPEDLDPRSLAGLSDLGIEKASVLEGALLAVRMRAGAPGREAVEDLVRRPEIRGFKIVVAVSCDVDLDDPASFLWGSFTRFEPARDVVFARTRLEGIRAVSEGPMGIDATHKPGYPDPLVMDPEVVDRVTRRWGEYFPQESLEA